MSLGKGLLVMMRQFRKEVHYRTLRIVILGETMVGAGQHECNVDD